MFDGSQVNLFIALLAGTVTFFASCLLPLVPTYLAYLSGFALTDERAEQKRWHIFKRGLFFVIGFTVTFIILGLTINKFAAVITPYRELAEKLAGLLFVTLGLFMMGVFRSQFLSQERRFDLHGKLQGSGSLHAVLTGIAFGFGWTPCIGPVLAVILFWAAQAETAFKGAMLLTAYGIGLGIPFLVIGLGLERIIPWLKKKAKISQVVSIISGLLVLGTGVLLLMNQFQNLSLYLIQLFNLNSLSA